MEGVVDDGAGSDGSHVAYASKIPSSAVRVWMAGDGAACGGEGMVFREEGRAEYGEKRDARMRSEGGKKRRESAFGLHTTPALVSSSHFHTPGPRFFSHSLHQWLLPLHMVRAKEGLHDMRAALQAAIAEERRENKRRPRVRVWPVHAPL